MSSIVDLSHAQWRKSSYSGSEGGDCVEVAAVGAHVAVRDSKDPQGPALVFPAAAFSAFVGSVIDGELRDR